MRDPASRKKVDAVNEEAASKGKGWSESSSKTRQLPGTPHLRPVPHSVFLLWTDWSISYTSTHRERQSLLLSTNGMLWSGESKQEPMHLFGHVLTLDSFLSGSPVPAKPSPVIQGQSMASLSHIRKPLWRNLTRNNSLHRN